ALAEAEPGDTVVIAGKGHEQGQEFEGGRKIPFDDRTVAAELLGEAAGRPQGSSCPPSASPRAPVRRSPPRARAGAPSARSSIHARWGRGISSSRYRASAPTAASSPPRRWTPVLGGSSSITHVLASSLGTARAARAGAPPPHTRWPRLRA